MAVCFSLKKLPYSSNINEVIRIVLNSLFFFIYEEILHAQKNKTQKAQKANKRLPLRCFYTPKKYKKQTSDFRLDVFYAHKNHKKQKSTKKHKMSSKRFSSS